MDQAFLSGAFVEIFLIQNPYFLDEFVRMHVSKDRVEKWLTTKALQDAVVSDTAMELVSQALNLTLPRPILPRPPQADEAISMVNLNVRRNQEPRVVTNPLNRRLPDFLPLNVELPKGDIDIGNFVENKRKVVDSINACLNEQRENIDPRSLEYTENRDLTSLDCLVSTSDVNLSENAQLVEPEVEETMPDGNTNVIPKERAEKKVFQCQECLKNFSCESKLRRHRVTHTGERNYMCEQCGKKFTQAFNLKAHMRKHSGTQPSHICGTCQKSFTKKIDLKLHQRLHTGEMPEKCEHCGMCFTFKQSLTAHLRIHTNERPYQCDQCDRKFTQSSNLKKHKLIHANLKPFHCLICKTDFRQSCNLKKHQRKHHGGRTGKEVPCVS